MDRSNQIKRAVGALLRSEAWKATLYLGPREIVRATRRYYQRAHGSRPNPKRIEVLVTIGRPNYQERGFIKACRKAGEPLPLRRVQLRFKKARRG